MQKFIHSSKNGGFAYCYLAPQVDEHLAAVGASTQGLLNRVAELEKALRELHTFFEDAPTLRAIVSNALMGSSS